MKKTRICVFSFDKCVFAMNQSNLRCIYIQSQAPPYGFDCSIPNIFSYSLKRDGNNKFTFTERPHSKRNEIFIVKSLYL